MKISEMLKGGAPLFSFEFFPPKTAEGVARLFQTIGDLKPLAPSFVSVTYGAGGSTRALTVDLVRKIKNELNIEAMAHLTCVGADDEGIGRILKSLTDCGIENVLALRGDPPHGQTSMEKEAFSYAFELVAYIRRNFQLNVGGAGYPEGHFECRDLEQDVMYLKKKVDAGLDFVITQLFFENHYFYDFRERALRAGIHVPILPGIMPITDVRQVKRFTQMCGASLPRTLLAALEAHRDDEAAILRMGISHAIAQCRDLLKQGVPGIHFYTLNKSTATQAVVKSLR